MMNFGFVASFSKTYATTTGADIDLVTDSSLTTGSLAMVVRQSRGVYMRIGGGGTLHIQYANGQMDTLTVATGEYLPPAAYAKILHDTSTAMNVTVFFA